MKIKKIEWRNFSSYGNRTQEINLGEDPNLYQAIGENGAGKSSISQVITFGLYGKVEGKKLKDIPNRINGNAWVRITLESGSTEVVVERGVEPSFFKLYLNGTEYDQAGVKSVQEYLSDDILGIPYYVFNNTISLSINDFKSFIKMSPQDKRAIIDKIFGFHILNQMREILKEENKRIRESLENISGRMQSLETSIQGSLSEMDRLTKKIEEDHSSQKEDLRGSLETFVNLQRIHGQKTEEFKVVESQIRDEISNAVKSSTESRIKLREIERRINLYDEEQCPVCHSPLSGKFHESIKEGLQSDKDSITVQIEDSDSLLSSLKMKESEILKTKEEILNKGKKIELKISQIQRELQILNESNSSLQLESLQRIVDNLQEERKKIESESYKSQEKSTWIKTLDEILSERGVKQMAIRTILPSLNNEISDLLSRMNLDYQVIFDDEFNASVYHMGVEIPTQSLSTGEMKKVDFAVLVSIIKLMKIKFSTINLLFLDELFSSIDPEGIYSLIKIVRSICKEMGLNVFVINHAPMPHEFFDRKIEVTKTNYFSTISIDKF